MSEPLKLSNNNSFSRLESSNIYEPLISTLDSMLRPKPLLVIKNISQTNDWRFLQKTCFKTASKRYFSYNSWQSEPNGKIKGIGSSFRRTSKSLSTLQINLPSNHIRDRRTLLINMRYLSYLKNLCLNFGYQRGVYCKHLDLSLYFKDLLLLHTLKLDFAMFPLITDGELEKTFSGFKYLTQLSILYLDLRSCTKVTEKSVKNIFKNLRNLTLLSKLNLNLNFSQNVIGKHTEPFSILSHLKSLLSLNLDLSTYDNYITNLAIKNLSTGIGHARSLVFLKLNLNDKGGISGKGLEVLSLALNRLINLNYFELKIKGCIRIDDKGMQSLSAGLSRLTSLLSLTIRLEECNYITDKGIQSLLTGIGHLIFLSTLTVMMVNCGNIADKSIEGLSVSISYLPRLNTLNLRLLSPESRITDLGIEALSLGFRCLIPNTLIDVRFSKCTKVTDKSIENLIATLKSRNARYHVTCNDFSIS